MNVREEARIYSTGKGKLSKDDGLSRRDRPAAVKRKPFFETKNMT